MRKTQLTRILRLIKIGSILKMVENICKMLFFSRSTKTLASLPAPRNPWSDREAILLCGFSLVLFVAALV